MSRLLQPNDAKKLSISNIENIFVCLWKLIKILKFKMNANEKTAKLPSNLIFNEFFWVINWHQ